MTKSKLLLASQASKTNTSNVSSSSNLQKSIIFNSTLPNTRNKVFNELFYESFVEKYNEKINLWQKYFLCVKNNYLYLYDKKPKSSEKPKEYLYLNNKISVTFHRRLFKLKAIKNYVVNIKIDNEALIKSSIEDNKHNLYISFKTQNNYNNFRRIFDNVINCKEYTNNSVSPNQNTSLQMKKYKSYRHIKNKSESHIQINNNLIEKNRKDEINLNNTKSHKSKNKLNSINKNNNSFTKSNINNVFTFSKIDNTNDKKVINSNSSKRSNSCNTNNRKNANNLTIEEENNNINSLKSYDINNNNNISNSKQSINYFNVNFNENNLKLKYKEDYSSLNNNIFYNDFSSSINISNSNIRPNTSLVYSIRRKKEKEREDENKMNYRYKKQRRNSCYRLTFTNKKYNNIFLQKNEKKEENKIKEIKIKLKDYHSFCNIRPTIISNINISDYSRDEKNISFLNNTGTQELTNYSFNEIEEKNSECKSSKSKEKEKEKDNNNDKTKNNTNTYTDISLCSLKSYKSESKEKEKEVKDNSNFPGIDLYSYIDTSNISKNKNNIEDNPTSFLENNNNNSNISKIRSQISQIIKKNEEIISKSQYNNDNDNEEKDNESDKSDTNIIFTSRIREEMTEHNSIKKESENSLERNKENYNDVNDTNKREIYSNEGCSNIINTSNIHQENHLRFSSDLNDLIQNLENNDNKNKNNNSNKISISFDSFYKRNLEFKYLDLNLDSIINDKNMMKTLITKIDNNEIFIYDSYICDLLLSKIKETLKYFNSIVEQKGNISKKKIIGKLYESINNKYAKYFLLCEMIANVSKYELDKIVINAIEINNKKKEINKEEIDVNYDEYVINIFNKYLSRNGQNNEYKKLYEEILPKKIKEFFQIKDSEGNLANIFKNEIHPNTLFNSMKYHNKISFYNIDIENENEIFPDFNSLNPLNNNFKYYISPYILEKWKSKASHEDKINSNKEEKEVEIYKLNKKYEKIEEAQKLNLFNIIISKINQNEINSALKNCEYFLERFKEKTSVLFPLIYLCIAFIYNKQSNHELSESYFNKCSLYINSFFPNKNNFLFFELEPKQLLLLLNNKQDIILENVENIMNIFEHCEKLWKKFYGESENIELKMDKIIFDIYFRINEEDKNNENFLNNLYYNNIRPIIGEFEERLKERKDIFKLCVTLFIEFFKKCPSCNLSIFNDLIRYYNSFQ